MILGRGRRRSPRKTRPGVVQLDGNVLSRRVFVQAVALAAGRGADETASGNGSSQTRPAERGPKIRHDHLILVAEDNKVNQVVIVQQLRALGYPADVVPDGREAFKRWESGDYAMLVTDLQMPEMDGYELSAAIRAVEKQKGRSPIPIVALSANVLKDEAIRCQAAGMDDYLAKPAGLPEIRAMLEKWLPADPDQEIESVL